MKNIEPKLLEFFTALGLNRDEISVFLTLSVNGEMTILQLSRMTDIPRTNLYRIIDRLVKQSFVTEIIDDHKTKLKAVSCEHLKKLVGKRSEEIHRLNKTVEKLEALLPGNMEIYQPATKVLFYRGLSGTKQMLWNILKAKGEFRGYSYITPVETVGKKFAIDWALEFNARKINARDLFSDSYKQSVKRYPYPKNINWPTWQSKYIAPDILNINHQIDVYNNVVSYYDWHGDEIFGVEIYNEKVASLQKQIFDAMWSLAGN